jgi:polyisoprenoid-binding protein YceI
MKLLSNLFLVAMIAIAFTSCKNNSEPTSDATEAAAESIGVDYMVSPDAAKINWEGSKPTGTHNGTISISEGTLSVADGAVTAGSFTIDMNSINVQDLEGDDKIYLEGHLKGTTKPEDADHFFNVATYPTAKFEIVSVTPTSGQAYNSDVKGNLTIRDITKEITIPANITVEDEIVVVTTEQFIINRTEWGINYGSKSIFDNLGDKFINDDIKLQIMVEAKAPIAAE